LFACDIVCFWKYIGELVKISWEKRLKIVISQSIQTDPESNPVNKQTIVINLGVQHEFLPL